MYITCMEDEAEGFAQTSLSIYEEMLYGLGGYIALAKSSGMKIGAKDMRKARSHFFTRWANTEEWIDRECSDYLRSLCTMYETDYEKVSPRLSIWYDDAQAKYARARALARSSNYGTFIAGMRFGASFHGLSDMLKDMHGSMGYLVQKKASEVKWNVRSTDGKTYSTMRYLHPYARLFAFRVLNALKLAVAAENGNAVDLLAPDGTRIMTADPQSLLNDKEIANRYFSFDTGVSVMEKQNVVSA